MSRRTTTMKRRDIGAFYPPSPPATGNAKGRLVFKSSTSLVKTVEFMQLQLAHLFAKLPPPGVYEVTLRSSIQTTTCTTSLTTER